MNAFDSIFLQETGTTEDPVIVEEVERYDTTTEEDAAVEETEHSWVHYAK